MTETMISGRRAVDPDFINSRDIAFVSKPRYIGLPEEPDLIAERIHDYLWETMTIKSLKGIDDPNNTKAEISIDCNNIWPGKSKSWYKEKWDILAPIIEKDDALRSLNINVEKARLYNYTADAVIINIWESIALEKNLIKITLTPSFLDLYRRVVFKNTKKGEVVYLLTQDVEKYRLSSGANRLAQRIAEEQIYGNGLLLSITELLEITKYGRDPKTGLPKKKYKYADIRFAVLVRISERLKGTRQEFTFSSEGYERLKGGGSPFVRLKFRSNQEFQDEVNKKSKIYSFEKHLVNIRYNKLLLFNLKNAVESGDVSENYINFEINSCYESLLTNKSLPGGNKPAAFIASSINGKWHLDEYKDHMILNTHVILSPMPSLDSLVKGKICHVKDSEISKSILIDFVVKNRNVFHSIFGKNNNIELLRLIEEDVSPEDTYNTITNGTDKASLLKYRLMELFSIQYNQAIQKSIEEIFSVKATQPFFQDTKFFYEFMLCSMKYNFVLPLEVKEAMVELFQKRVL